MSPSLASFSVTAPNTPSVLPCLIFLLMTYHSVTSNTVIIYSIYCLSPQLENKLHEGKDFIHSLLLFSYHIEQ